VNGGEKAKAVDEDHDADHDHISSHLPSVGYLDEAHSFTARYILHRRTAVWGRDGESRVQRQVEQRGQRGGLDRFTHMCATVTLPRSAASPLPS
jgi:hypothetical protein